MKTHLRRWMTLSMVWAAISACPGERKLPPGPWEDGTSLPPDRSWPLPPRDWSGPPDRGSRQEGGQGQEAGTGPVTSCQGSGVTFTVYGNMQPCTQVKITVQAPGPLEWVIVGVQGKDSAISWVGGVSESPCSNGTCVWTFPTVSVPCGSSAPYSLHFMKNATYDNPSVGEEIASCSP